MAERMRVLSEQMEDIKLSLSHMATKEQVAQLVGRNEFERQTWALEQLRIDMERESKALREEIERSSVRKLWGNLTAIVGGLLSIAVLVVTLTGWRPH